MTIKTTILLVFVQLLVSSCLENFDLQSQVSSQSVLVVEATITNELKQQEVYLSRSLSLESDGPVQESGAQVKVVSNSSEYIFQEIQAGRYVSSEPFAAQPNLEYKLEVISSDGKIYRSSGEVLHGESNIDELNYDIGLNENGDEGISILVKPVNSLASSEFYRYTYEETYKIIAPFYSPQELIPLIEREQFPFVIAEEFEGFTTLTEVIDYLVDIQFREEQEQLCYNTVASSDIILGRSDDFVNGIISDQRVRFLNKDNYIISHRYSILVKQFGQSQEANTFYTILKDISESEDIFSTLQPGFFSGNVYSVNTPDEKVAGFFEVASLDQRRIYFNYSDVFPNQDLPPYVIACDDLLTPLILVTDGDGNAVASPLIDDMDNGQQFYLLNGYDEDESPFEARPFTLVLPECGDCTVLGNNMPPDFWIE